MKKRFTMIISIMIFVGVIALLVLAKDHTAVSAPIRFLIAIGGALLSGGIAYLLSIEKKEENQS